MGKESTGDLFGVKPSVSWRLVDLDLCSREQKVQAADILVRAFKDLAPGARPDLEAGLAEVTEACAPGRFGRAAVTGKGEVIGWIGAIECYSGHAWELHPLAVDPLYQGAGIGMALVLDLEAHAERLHVLTVFVGADDAIGATSLADRDLYTEIADQLKEPVGRRPHPLGFYQKLGYRVVGVLPDVNGRGRPDIFLAKRLGEP